MHCIFSISYKPVKIYNIKLDFQSDCISYKHLDLPLFSLVSAPYGSVFPHLDFWYVLAN